MVKHPAKYTEVLLPVFEQILSKYECEEVLDCFAGTGKIHKLPFTTTGLELEEEWASQSENTIIGDATKMPFEDNYFCAVCTSPTYGNRMADSHNAKDGSSRNTYTHKIGRRLADNNTGKMQWGKMYREMHEKAWNECFRVLKSGGVLILNFKNHIRKGAEVDVFGWHIKTLMGVGFVLRGVEQVEVKGNGFGQNGGARVPFEYVATFEKTI
jgi:SAM-dependent methyltransferase